VLLTKSGSWGSGPTSDVLDLTLHRRRINKPNIASVRRVIDSCKSHRFGDEQMGVRSSPSKCVFHTYLTKDCWGPLGTAGDGWGRLGTAGDGWRCWGPLGIVICNGIYIW
jgi:hypothetical protein